MKNILQFLSKHDKRLHKAIYNHYNNGDCIGYIKCNCYIIEYPYYSGCITSKQAIKICKLLNKFSGYSIDRLYYKDIYVDI